MADENKVTLMEKWFDDIRNDENLVNLTEQDIAYIMYAAANYGFTGQKTDIGAVFGSEFRGLNFAMSNIYGQIDRISGYGNKMSNGRKVKYDSEAIKNLRLTKHCTAVQICDELGYDRECAKSILSNKGWVEAGKILAEQKAKEIQKSTDSIQITTEKIQKSTENLQKSTDSVQQNVFNF
jgi:hypothetical protein